MKQLNLFTPEIIHHDHLVAPESPKQAYYKIWLEQHLGRYSVRKESGIHTGKLDERTWPFEDPAKAEKFYARKLREKTREDRKSNRKYVPFCRQEN